MSRRARVWARRAGLAVRQTGVYAAFADHIVTRIRSSARVDRAVERALPRDTAPGRRVQPFRAGRHITGAGVDRLPIVVIAVLGEDGRPATDEKIDLVTSQVIDLQRRSLAFRPLWCLDRPRFDLSRDHGYVVELVTPRDRWPQQWGSHEAYIGQRLVALLQGYRAWGPLRAGRDGVSDTDQAFVAALARQFPPDDPPVVAPAEAWDDTTMGMT